MNLTELVKEKSPVAVVTVVDTVGSSPTRAGAWMAVRPDGSVLGSIAGGCVEAAVYSSALEVLDGAAPRTEEYGPDGDLFRPGLTCGGRLTVWISLIDHVVVTEVAERVAAGALLGIETVLEGPDQGRMRVVEPHQDSLTGRKVAERYTGLLENTFVQTYEPPARMVLVGSTSYAQEMCAVGARLGYRVTVCDARAVFTTPERFSDGADEVICDWPARWIATERETGGFDERTIIIVLTHDPKIDIPVLAEVLDESLWTVPPAYIGALGSANSDQRRRIALREQGITDEEMARMHSPIGLDIGDETPAQTAISIAAQIISAHSPALATRPARITQS